MKKTTVFIKLMFTCGLFLVLAGFIVIREDQIVTLLNKYFFAHKIEVTLGGKNKYYRDYNFKFVQNTNNFQPREYQDILNIYYTVINAGKNSFSFYCPKEYEDCVDDIKALANDQSLLSDINNYVHPYNGFSHIETEYDSLGKVTINIMKSYKEEDIIQINNQIDELYPTLVNENATPEDNIRNVHDYIINHTKYDASRSDENVVKYKSDIAYGPLFEGFGICGGYTDLMELFLEKMGIRSFKVSSDNHIWNAVLIGNRWYHLDLTWDDPVASDGKDYLEHGYFLINTPTLLASEKTQHNFNIKNYPELKEEA